MKNWIITYLLSTFLLLSCDDHSECEFNQEIVGSWYLSEVNNNLGSTSEPYDDGQIIWKFSEQTLSITYNLDEDEYFPLWDFFAWTTTYDLVIEQDTFLVDVSPYFGAMEPNLFAMPYVIEDTNNRMVVDFRSPFGDAPWIVFESTCPN